MSFTWLTLSPIPIIEGQGAAQPDESAQKKAFAADLLAAQGGEAWIRALPGNKVLVNGVEREWKTAKPIDGMISLNSPEHNDDFQVAYASTEFDVPSDTTAWLGIGSDDGIRVWLNGALVHDRWIARPVQVDEDVVRVPIKAGKNRLVIKVQNISGSWGFACRLMDAESRAERLTEAVRTGDLVATKDLVDKGFDLNARTSDGLTPFLAACIWGQKEVGDFLAEKGADTRAPRPAPEALVDALLAKRINNEGAGAAVLVARNGRILYEKARGLADIERRQPVTVDTKFRIGSITKQFTASGILRLQETGRLKVTDPLSRYIPDFPRGGEVTLQHLLTHTSGIHGYTESAGFMQNVTKPTSTAEVIASIEKFPYDFNPGVRWSYSNSGYFILGSIIEKVSGQEYGDFLRKAFFVPLGMTGTGVYHNARPPSGAAVGYEYENGQFKKALDWDMSWAGGAGSIYSTVKDLYLWNEAVFGGRVLSREDLAAAFSPVITEENKNDKSADGYGYGWGITHFRGAREVSHNGGLNGFLSILLRFPEQNFTVGVLANEFPPKPRTDPGTLAHEIAELYLGSELAPRPAVPARAAKPVSGAALAAIVGRYDYRSAVLVVTQEGDRVYAQLGGQPRFEIFPKSDTEFFWKVVDAQVTFVKDASGKVVSAVHHQGGQTIHAPRLADVAEIKLEDAQTDPLLGEYDFKPAGRLAISREGGRMYAQLTGQSRLELGATSETEFFLRMVNAQLTFVKRADGTVTEAVLHQGGQNYEMLKIGKP